MNRETQGHPRRPRATLVSYLLLGAVVLLTIWGVIYLWKVLASVVEWGM